MECAKRDGCAIRWFHLPCVGLTGDTWGVGEQWHCPDCAADITVEQEKDEAMGESMTEKHVDSVMMGVCGDLEMSGLYEEVEQEDWVPADPREVITAEQVDVRESIPELDFRDQSSDAMGVEMANVAPDDLPTTEEETTQHSRIASPISRAQSAPAQLVIPAEVTIPANTSPASRELTPAVSMQSRHENLAPEEELPDSMPMTSEEASAVLHAASEEADLEQDVEHGPDEDLDLTSHLCLPNCGLYDTSPMVACNGNCKGQWFHYSCVGLTTKPRSGRDWYCPTCRQERRNNRAAPKKCPSRSRKRDPRQRKRSASRATSQQEQPANIAISQQGQQATQPSRPRRTTRKTAEPEYCTCGTPGNKDMIACDANCAKQWFHFTCVGLTARTVPDGAWYCPECKVEEDRKMRKAARRKAV